MPTKICFSVFSCSGEDERYRATELNYHGPTVKGWRSAHHCIYPQELTIQLATPAILHRIQILSHQHLISQKIEIWTSDGTESDPSLSPVIESFVYLGFITLSDNQNTQFKSRELKSVTVPPTAARYIKFIFHSNHINHKNVSNQVGIVAVNVLGEEIPQVDTDDSEEINNNSNSQVFTTDSTVICNPQYMSPYDDLAFNMYVDKDVARIMRIMETKKHQAVIDERFEYAGKLKVALEDLREVGELLGKFEQEKKQAIHMEDYDRAKAKKLQIQEYREQIYSLLEIDELIQIHGVDGLNDLCNESPVDQNSRKQELTGIQQQQEQGAVREFSQQDFTACPKLAPTTSPGYCTTSVSEHILDQHSLQNVIAHSRSQSFSDHQALQLEGIVPSFRFPARSPHSWQNFAAHPASDSSGLEQQQVSQQHNSKMLQLSSNTQLDSVQQHNSNILQLSSNTQLDSVQQQVELESMKIHEVSMAPRPSSLHSSLRRRNKSACSVGTKSSYEAYEERTLPALKHYHCNDVVRECQLVGDQSRKSKLNEREKKQAALPISVFGLDMVEKFYSKHFTDKEEGLKMLRDELKATTRSTPGQQVLASSHNKMARATIFLLHRALRDKVYSVYSGAADTIRLFFTEFVPGRVSSSEVARSVERLLPELISKSGDTTPRIHNMAAHTLLSMADCKEVRDLHLIPVHLSRPLASSVHPRLALSRLEMIEQLILSHGISTEKQSGLTSRTLAEFGSSGLHHPAEAVRKVSERILIQVYRVNPRLVRKQLPPDDDVTRRNLLYRQLFQEFDSMDLQRKKEMATKEGLLTSTRTDKTRTTWEYHTSDVNVSKGEFKQKVKRDTKKSVSQLKPPNNEKILPQSAECGNYEVSVSAGVEINKSEQDIRDEEEIAEPHITQELQISNENVHSEQVTDRRLASARSLKSLKYIFPTSYIGNCALSQATVNLTHDSVQGNRSVNSATTAFASDKLSLCADPFFASKELSNQIISVDQKTSTEIPKVHESNVTCALDIAAEPLSSLNGKERNLVSSSSSASVPSDGETQNKSKGQDGKTHKMCIFCFTSGDWFTEESLNIHYWKECPMLTRCLYCKQVVEISGLVQHRLDDCIQRNMFQRCLSCHEAVLKESFSKHQCIVPLSNSQATRCPLCHSDIGEKGTWREHLMGENVCPSHPRKKKAVTSNSTQEHL